MRAEIQIREITEWDPADLNAMSSLLSDVVADGASIGFLSPLPTESATIYWQSALSPDIRLWIAEHDGVIVGTVQLQLGTKQNGLHRAEIAKLMVHPNARRLGIAGQLMNVAEQAAVEERRSLLVLDTRGGDPSNLLYSSRGYVEAGRIPQYAKSSNGRLDETVFYYKLLSP